MSHQHYLIQEFIKVGKQYGLKKYKEKDVLAYVEELERRLKKEEEPL